ncbi:MAG: alpha/beta hydrolase [Pseudomonadota bacterium]
MMWTTRQRSEISGQSAIVAGEGPPVLLLHGVGLRADAWGAQLDALSQNARVVAPDMAGHGEKCLDALQMELSDYITAAGKVLQSFDGKAVLVGHSMGAMIALALAEQMPERVGGVAALNAVFERSPEAAASVQVRASSLDGKTIADPSDTLQRWFGPAASPERAVCWHWLNTIDPAAYKLAYSAFATSKTPGRKLLSQIQCPALFMTGSLEPNSTPAMSQAMAELAPQGQAVIVEGAAHMMPMTHPNQVNAALTDFMKGCAT